MASGVLSNYKRGNMPQLFISKIQGKALLIKTNDVGVTVYIVFGHFFKSALSDLRPAQIKELPTRGMYWETGETSTLAILTSSDVEKL